MSRSAKPWTIPNSSIDPLDPDFGFRKLFADTWLFVDEWVGGAIVRGVKYHIKALGVSTADMTRQYGWDGKYRRVKFEDLEAYFDPEGPGQRRIVKIVAPNGITAQDRKRWRHRQALTRVAYTSYRVHIGDYDRMKLFTKSRGFKHMSQALKFLMDHYEKTTGEILPLPNGSTAHETGGRIKQGRQGGEDGLDL